MMVIEDGREVPFIVHPTDEMAGEEWFELNRMPGLLALTRLLRHPEFDFGEPSERRADDSGDAVDWQRAPYELRRYLAYWGTRCGDAMLLIGIAANIARRHGVRICRGEPSLNFLWEEGLMSIVVDLSVDASCDQVELMNDELLDMTLFLDIPHRGFSFYFTLGEGGEEDIEASLARRVATARDLEVDLEG